MTVEVKIVGFDRISEHVAFEVAVPPNAVADVKKIAAIPATDPDLMGSYPLNPQQLKQIAVTAHIAIDPTKFRYFLEAYEEL